MANIDIANLLYEPSWYRRWRLKLMVWARAYGMICAGIVVSDKAGKFVFHGGEQSLPMTTR
jgi:hypothetical protein